MPPSSTRIPRQNMAQLTLREAAIDAVIRFVTSLDEPSPTLMTTSLTPTAILDITPFYTRLAWQHCTQPIRTRDAIVKLLMDGVGTRLDTTHSATNIRCTMDTGLKTGLIECTVLAQHFRLGEGLAVRRERNEDYFLGANRYYVKVVRWEAEEGEEWRIEEGEEWRIEEVKITPLWTVGNEEVMDFSSVERP